MIKKIIITVIILVVALVIGVKGKELLEKRKEEIISEPIPEKSVMSISVVYGESGEIREDRSFLATVQPDKSVKISTKIAGYIKKVYVKEGDIVKKGTLLVSIDEDDIDSNIKILKNSLTQEYNELSLAKEIYNRNKKLYEIGGLPREQLETSKVIFDGKSTVIKGTKEKIKQLENQKSYLKIKAPFSGVVDNILLYGGDLAVMGKPILTISSGIKKLLFSYSLDSTDIKVGQKVFWKGENIGDITTIKSLAKDGLAEAETILNQPLNIPFGSSITVDVLIKKAQGCIVPNSTLIHKKDGTYIMVYNGSRFTRLKVETLLSNSQDTILSSCPKEPIAIGNEVELVKLGAYKDVNITLLNSF